MRHIHQNLSQSIVVGNLAEMVNMSRPGFHKSFEDAMHLSPLQYAKTMRLFGAQTLTRDGKNAGEAGCIVGYSSPTQPNREYKRHLGYSPSATR